MQLLVDILGYIGMVMLLIAFGLISMDKVTSKNVSYQWMNLIGGVFLMINTYYYGAFPSAVLNLVWLIIAFVYLYKIYQQNKASKIQTAKADK